MPETLTDSLRHHQDRRQAVPRRRGRRAARRAPDRRRGASIDLEPLLLAGGGSDAKFGASLDKAVVNATIVGHERGPKIRIFKYKPKRGYKRRMGHRQELTRIRVDKIGS